jgi:MYXO-CTERM domain-containing protein
LSGNCTGDASGDKFCVEQCDNTKDSCPHGFTCLATGADTGVCWPAPGGGCCSGAPGSPAGPFVLGVGLLGFVLRRRR